MQQVDDDNQDNEPITVDYGSEHQRWSPIRVSDLFNFDSTEWVNRYSHFANLSFDEELELYELLELDADGENDPDIDGTTQEILLN